MSRFETPVIASHTAADIGVRYVGESASARVDVDHHVQLLSIVGNVSEVDSDAFVISTASSSGVVASMNDSLRSLRSKIDKLSLLFVNIQSDDRSVKVNAAIAAGPAQSDDHAVGARRKLCHIILFHGESSLV